MKYREIQGAKMAMITYEKNWRIPFFEFVDDFRRKKGINLIDKPLQLTNEKFDSLLASTVEYLCDELGIDTPNWVWNVPSCKKPWFVSGYDNLKAISISESPVYFRRRKIFVLKNFLSRV